MNILKKIFYHFTFLFLFTLFSLIGYCVFYVATFIYIGITDNNIVSTDYKQYGTVTSIHLNNCKVGKNSLYCSFSTDTHNFTNTDITRYPNELIKVGDKIFTKTVNYSYKSKFNKCKNNMCLPSGTKIDPKKLYKSNYNNILFLIIAIIFSIIVIYFAIHFAYRLVYNGYNINKNSIVDTWSDLGMFPPKFYLKCSSCETAYSDNIAIKLNKKNKQCPCCDTTVNPTILNGVGIYKVPANNAFTRFFKIPNYTIKQVK